MAQKTEQKANSKEKAESIVATPVGTRGRVFEGTITKKFPTRVVIEFERTVFITKYERYARKKTRLHARIPAGMNLEIGDYVKVRECRPLSKIIHFVVIEKIRSANKEAKK